MSDGFFESDIPSKQWNLLTKMVGQSITKVVRFSDIKLEEAEEYNLARSEFFSRTLGPVLIYLDSGIVVGGSSDPSIISLQVWLERDRDGETSDWEVERDETLWPISAEDGGFGGELIRNCIGQNIESVAVLKRLPEYVLWESKSCEVGVVIALNNGATLVLSHGLHDGSDDFSVITAEEIDPTVRDKLYEILNSSKGNEA